MFAFDADTWDACVGPPVMLTRVFRQKVQGNAVAQYACVIRVNSDE